VLWVVRFDERICVAVLSGGHGVYASVVCGGQRWAQIELRWEIEVREAGWHLRQKSRCDYMFEVRIFGDNT
jgi:hypothetical protein